MSMPITEVREEVDTISPFVGPTSPVMFGIEHEYALDTDPDDYDSCRCPDCRPEEDDDDRPPGCLYRATNLLPGWDQCAEHCGWEVKSAPMTDIGLAVSEFRRIERELGWGGHYDCGYHIHLNADPSNGAAVNVVRFAENWLAHRDTLWRHCPSDDGYIGVTHGREYAGAMSRSVTEWMANRERYCEVNWLSLESHTTLEVRLAKATANMEHFELWLRYVLAIAADSLLSANPAGDYLGWVHRGNAADTHLCSLGIEVEALITGGPV